MPPKAKFTKDEILNTALNITREQGIDAATARALGARLGSSPRPIFTIFKSMEEVKDFVILKAKESYGQYVEEGLKNKLAFRGVGIAYIRFAIEEPRLFQLLFMTAADSRNISAVLPLIDEHYVKILKSVQEPYHLDKAAAEKIYQHLWTYTHGIAAMFATGLCSCTMEQLEERLTEVFQGLLLLEKRKNS